jgi:putative exporter of polyketide antibiotics
VLDTRPSSDLAGSLSGFRQGLLGLEPFTHIPRVGSGSFSPVLLLL